MTAEPEPSGQLHGIAGYFAESARCRRRVSLLSVATGTILLGGLAATQLPFVRHAVETTSRELRFGFEGPTLIVPVIQLDSPLGVDEALRDVGQLVPQVAGGGRGGGTPSRERAARPAEHAGPSIVGAGNDPHDLVRRALENQGSVRIFQSEELVIVHLVRPEYPEEARERGIEGKVSVLALIDTLGVVSDAEVMNASGEPVLDHAAESAVRQCRFKPYQEDGATREVYAVFRFAFRIY
jgi:TonB family protein